MVLRAVHKNGFLLKYQGKIFRSEMSYVKTCFQMVYANKLVMYINIYVNAVIFIYTYINIQSYKYAYNTHMQKYI